MNDQNYVINLPALGDTCTVCKCKAPTRFYLMPISEKIYLFLRCDDHQYDMNVWDDKITEISANEVEVLKIMCS